ncbi:MAG TPA: hypothetical protein VFG42_01330 [Baekduia sp.]|uniref:hypothetical protein n=1 Tax=Baekduia sp. TaxID=2600305 RepID=UPI002D77CE71|nr:hypothetical protein [Baekduia sp.]HET6505404.1 hypothetical protein [Baekduia sp.]
MLAALVSVDPLGDRGNQTSSAAFLVLLSFVVAFLAIRTSARMTRSVSWWPGSVRTGDVHLHHLVWGICLMMLSGFLAFVATPGTPFAHLTAIGFGVGAGFTMDEFALWVHLEDVYWEEEGRRSIDAAVIAVAFAAMVVAGTTPFGLDDPGSVTGTAVVVLGVLALSVLCFMKGRILLGVLGLFVPLFGLVGAFRLGRPGSPWARHRYSEGRMARARDRFSDDRRLERARHRIVDALIGKTTERSGGSDAEDASA